VYPHHFLFTADTGQVITAQPQAIKHPTQAGNLVFFGTGKYIEATDNSDVTVQSYYGIWDDKSNSEVLKTELRQRKILSDKTSVSGAGFTARVTSALTDDESDGGGYVDWGGNDGSVEKGGYFDFSTIAAERVISESIVRNKEIVFTTIIPSEGKACDAGGEGVLMALDLEYGTAPKNTLFDINGDGDFNKTDDVNNNPISGIHVDGIPAAPLILDNPSGESEAYINTTEKYQRVRMRGASVDEGTRKSWVQIFL
jgi:type IV pilus assembly protein PilY1